jgi:hypothetical protein
MVSLVKSAIIVPPVVWTIKLFVFIFFKTFYEFPLLKSFVTESYINFWGESDPSNQTVGSLLRIPWLVKLTVK